MDKYKELFDLARESIAQAEGRFDTIDSKASTYLSVLTLLLGSATFFARWVADELLPPRDASAWVLVVLAVVTIGFVTRAWFLVLAALRVHRIKILPLNQETIEFFDRNRLVDIYHALARGYSEAWQANQAINDQKLAKLTSAYRSIIVTIVLVLLFGLLYGMRAWLGAAN